MLNKIFFSQRQLGKPIFVLGVGLALFILITWGVRLIKRSKRVPEWLKAAADSSKVALQILVLGLSILFASEATVTHFGLISPLAMDRLQAILFIVCMTAVLFAAKRTFENFYLMSIPIAQTAEGKTMLQAVGKVVSAAIVLFSLLLTLDVFGLNLTAIYAFGGIGGLALSLAGKEVIANFFGGLMVYLTHPFYVGDSVKSPNKGFDGVVVQIGWYRTEILNADKNRIFIPNSIITDAIIENRGYVANRKLTLQIHLDARYVDKVATIAAAIQKMLEDSIFIEPGKSLVHFQKIGLATIELEVATIVRTTEEAKFREQRQEILLAISSIVRKHGAEFAVAALGVLEKS